jgi:hypothetical protein
MQPGGMLSNHVTSAMLVFVPGMLNSIHRASGRKSASRAMGKPST